MKMIEEVFNGYILKANPVETSNGKWSVSVVIETDNGEKRKRFYAHDKIYYILEIEAAKECLNLGRNLIKSNLVGF